MVGDPVAPNIVKPISVVDDYTYTRNYQADVIIIDESYNAPSNYISPVSCLYLTLNTYQNCTNITSVNLHNVPFVNNNMSNAFYDCFNLTSVTGINENVIHMDYTFYNCSNLVNAPVIPNSVTNMVGTFYFCYNLVNAPVIPNSVTNMAVTFACCSNLVNTPIIPNSVTDMFGTFGECNNLLNPPIIPNSVTNMAVTFYNCSNLVNAPVIPNSVTDMALSFEECTNLVNAPVIPNSVTNMYRTFNQCSNLTGNMYIQSENITNATNCFNQTSLTKNVYIPFTYENGVNTLTYNSFINAGYTTNGSVNGVYLKDINKNTVNITLNLYTNNTNQQSIDLWFELFDGPNGSYINTPYYYNIPVTKPRTVFTVEKEVDDNYYGFAIGGDNTDYGIGPYNPIYINGVAYNTYTEMSGPTTYYSPMWGQTAFQITGDTTISDTLE